MRNKIFFFFTIASFAVNLLAATCRITVTTEHAHGDGVRLLPTETVGKYVAVVDTGADFTATVLADEMYVIADTGHTIPKDVTFNATMGFFTIPAAVLQENAASGISLNIVARPIKYQILYHAHGDGEPAIDNLRDANEDRTWIHSVDTANGDKVKLATAGTLNAEGWKFLGWSRIQGQTRPDFEPGAELDHLSIKDGSLVKLYAVWDTTNEDGKVSYPVVLQNGGFEVPLVPVDKKEGYTFFAGATIAETEIVDHNGIGWSTTAKDGVIEIGCLTNSSARSNYGLNAARDGLQIAELNANNPGLLYQRIATLPNKTLHWGFSHRARGKSTTEETMSMWIGSAEQIEQAREIYYNFALKDTGEEGKLTAEEALAQVAELAAELQFTNIVHTAKVDPLDKSSWYDITGDFVVPSGRTVVEYAFASWVTGDDSSDTKAATYGNLLDRVYLSDVIPVEKYNLKITLGEGGSVYLNDSSKMTKIESSGEYLASYDVGTKILMAIAMNPDSHYVGIMTNGVFVARENTALIFQDLSENGLKEDLAIDFVFAGASLIQFRTNGGTYKDTEGNEITHEKLSVAHPTYTPWEAVRDGYEFLGWRSKSGVWLELGSFIALEPGSSGEAVFVCYDKNNVELLRVPAEDGLTLFAQWELDENAISSRPSWDVIMSAENVIGDNTIMKHVDYTPGTWIGKALDKEDFVTTVFAASGYRLPASISITDNEQNPITGYTYNSLTGVIYIPGEYVTRKLTISIAANRIRYNIVYSSGGKGEIAGDGVQKVDGSVGVWQQKVEATGETVTLASKGTLETAGWQFLGWSRDAAATKAEYNGGASVQHLTSIDMAEVKLYAIWKAEEGNAASSYPVSLENGSFEQPSNLAPPSGYTTSYYIQYKQGVEDKQEVEGLNWHTTASDGKIEIGSVGSDAYKNSCISAYHTGMARDGVQFAELNADKIGALYQDVATVPGVTLYWGYSHKAREEGDALALIIGSPEEFKQALDIYKEKVTSKPAGWQQEVLNKIKALNLSSLQINYHLADYDASDLVGWEDLIGTYKVPADQSVTKFAFLSLSEHNETTKGNLIDQVYFTTSEPIQTATLKVMTSAGGTAKINDGGAELSNVTKAYPYFKVVAKEKKVIISPIAEEGWTFLGLYLGTVFHPLANCDEYLNFEMPTEDRKITLLFAKDRTITFNTEGGSYPEEHYRLSTSVPEYKLETPSRSGYDFKGWKELTSGNVYAAGSVVKYEVEPQYEEENVRSYLVIGESDTQVKIESERGLILSAVWEVTAAMVDKKLVTFVDRDYTSSANPQPFKLLFNSYLAVGANNTLKSQTGLKEIYENTTASRPVGFEPAGWTYEATTGTATFDFDYILKVEHEKDGEKTYFNVYATTNGVSDVFRFDGVQSMRFVARWDRFYDVTRMEADGVTTNRTAWVPKSWLDAKGYTDITEENYKTKIEENGDNGVPLYQSYIFGLDPKNASSVALNHPFQSAESGKMRFSLKGVNVVKYINDIYTHKSGNTPYSAIKKDYRTYKAVFVLTGSNDLNASVWNEVAGPQESSVFDMDMSTLGYRYYRVEARIMKKSE